MADLRSVIVLAPNWLGDAVMALPAIDDLRRHFAPARIIVAARRSVAQLFALVPFVDAVVELEWRGKGGDLGAMSRDIGRLRGLKADLAVLLPNSFASAWLTFAARIPQRVGYARDGRSFLLTRAVSVPNAESHLHQGAYYQELVRALGATNGPLQPRIVVSVDQLNAARTLLTAAGWNGSRPLAVFAPGAAYGTAKRWWPTHFARLAADVISEGAHVVLVGSVADSETASEVLGMMPPSPQAAISNLTGRTTLETLAGVLSLANVCVSNDSGAMHVAAATGVPLAALFGPTNEKETAPLVHAPLDLLIHPVSCRPCMLRECPIDHPCMRDLTPERVLASVNRLLDASEVSR